MHWFRVYVFQMRSVKILALNLMQDLKYWHADRLMKKNFDRFQRLSKKQQNRVRRSGGEAFDVNMKELAS